MELFNLLLIAWFILGAFSQLSFPPLPRHHPSSLLTTSKTAPLHRRRPTFDRSDLASAADWTTYTLKGGALTCGLRGSDSVAGFLLRDPRIPPSAASPWTGDFTQDLQKWYWQFVAPTAFSCGLSEFWEIGSALNALGLDGRRVEDGGDNQCWRVEHWDPGLRINGRQVPAVNQWYGAEGREYRATQAHFDFGINVKGGAIYGFYLLGAKSAASTLWYAGRRDPDPNDLPQLRAFSDILWGFWTRDNPDVKNIRYFVMLGIANEQTNQLIASCLHNAGKGLTEWPGAEFSTNTDEGHALLGSPNGAAFAYFLMQHKAELGQKIIEKVTVFKPDIEDDETFVDAALWFHVGNAQDPIQGEKVKVPREEGTEQWMDMVRVHNLRY